MAGTGPGIVMSQGRIRFLSIGMAVNHSRLPGAGSELSTEMRIMFGSSFSSSLRRSIAVVVLRRNPKRKSRANEHMFWLHYRGFRWVAGAKSSKPRHEAKNLALEPGLRRLSPGHPILPPARHSKRESQTTEQSWLLEILRRVFGGL